MSRCLRRGAELPLPGVWRWKTEAIPELHPSQHWAVEEWRIRSSQLWNSFPNSFWCLLEVLRLLMSLSFNDLLLLTFLLRKSKLLRTAEAQTCFCFELQSCSHCYIHTIFWNSRKVNRLPLKIQKVYLIAFSWCTLYSKHTLLTEKKSRNSCVLPHTHLASQQTKSECLPTSFTADTSNTVCISRATGSEGKSISNHL